MRMLAQVYPKTHRRRVTEKELNLKEEEEKKIKIISLTVWDERIQHQHQCTEVILLKIPVVSSSGALF